MLGHVDFHVEKFMKFIEKNCILKNCIEFYRFEELFLEYLS